MHVATASATRLLAGVGALSLVSALAYELVDERFTFAPDRGAESTRTFSESTSLEIADAMLLVGGQEDEDLDGMTMDVVQRRSVQVTDVYGESKGGAPRSLTRTYDSIASEIGLDLVDGDGDTEEADCEGVHPLESHEVVFEWKDDEEAAVPRFADGDAGDDAWLDDLSVDMDLASFLVADDDGGEKEEGGRWTIDPESFLDLTRPGGIVSVPFDINGNGEVGLFFTCLLSTRDVLEDPEGEVEVFWKSTREVDGALCAVCDLDVSLKGGTDIRERLFSEIAEVLPEAAGEVEIIDTAAVTIALEGEGELVWNLEARRLHSVEIELDNQTELRASGADDTEGVEVELMLSFEGSTILSVKND